MQNYITPTDFTDFIDNLCSFVGFVGEIYPLHKGAARMSFSYAYARANVINKEEYHQRREMRLKQNNRAYC